MSTALYRRYRPESFADVIGQEHVTLPLMTALEKNRVNHAYLFSGPRGCGKTTSARILARCLNCAQGPTPTPCGECQSCRDLSRDGGGSLDVIEMDAASHGGVDHARDLRERATFAPVRDRYKIFIIDEAHMVTREGFNALLKIVEEPPAHIKFIFATTEPNKVLGTIRSRTHHYPFRLVPPQILGQYLSKLCSEEGVQVAEGVIPLVVRAGGGSVRDSLSILDQLMAGASSEQGITYDLAVALLGFTHGELLDEVVDAFAGGEAAQVFASVDRVIQTGQDPRRFVEDLLERFRDLIIVKAVPDTAGSILRGLAADQLERMRAQAKKLGSAELSRAADLTNEALNEMGGAMNPQLHLELLCARILLTSGEQSLGALAARLERLEGKIASGPQATPTQGAVGRQDTQTGQSLKYPMPAASGPTAQEQGSGPSASAPATQSSSATEQAPKPLASAPFAGAPLAGKPLAAPPLRAPAQPPAGVPSQAQPAAQASAPAPTTPAPTKAPLAAATTGENTVNLVLNSWSDILSQVPSSLARAQFAQCQPVRFENGSLFLLAELPVLKSVKDYLPQLQQALLNVLGLQVQLRGEIKRPGGGSAPPTKPTPTEPTPTEPTPSGPVPHQPSPEPSQDPTSQAMPLPPENTERPGLPAQGQNQGLASPPPVELAQGPRGGDQAWEAHGQPLSDQPPSWSPDDWSAPVTSWNVAAIPSEDQQVPAQEEAAGSAETPHSPHLRVIEGDADPVEIAKAQHPSQGAHERNAFAVAPQRQEDPEVAPTPEQEPEDPDEPSTGFAPARPAVAPLAPQAAAQATVQPQEQTPAPAEQGQHQTQERKLSFRERHAAQIAAGKQALTQSQQQAPVEEAEDFTPSDDDAALESAVLIGQKAVEKILGGKVIDEQPLHQG
ncbi:DNA polymerase III subunit gamma and tau [Rothia sp. P4278]|uniref:DNA polymerase III subunit gamma and tau n=1 Tax=Rothia sp. P4278 TaxID=3402658 RepID=UPI003AD976A8